MLQADPDINHPRRKTGLVAALTINQSSGTMERLYFSHASLGGWGNDQLGENVLPPGRSVSYRAANTGHCDVRVVRRNGRSSELRGINVCQASTILVTNRGLSAS